jgi:hypothetical protein
LQYSEDRQGPWSLYVYLENSGYHCGARYFRKEPRREEMSIEQARAIAQDANAVKREVRIVDSGDMLVFHAKGGKVLHGGKFWEEIGGSGESRK